jgi:hypothetical protein
MSDGKLMVAPGASPFAKDTCWQADSICLRVLMQVLACEVAREWMKLGRAIADKSPMIATTIIISTKVNPLESLIVIVRFVFIFIDVVNLWQADYIIAVHGLPAGNVKGFISTRNAIIQFPKYCAPHHQLEKPGASKQKTPKPSFGVVN